MICRYLLKNYETEQLLRIIINLFLILAAVFFVLSFSYGQSIILIGIGSGLMFFACGFIFPMSMGKGISLFRHIAGTASATMYLINILITSLSSFLVSFLAIHSAVPLMLIYFSLLLIAAVIYWWMIYNCKTAEV